MNMKSLTPIFAALAMYGCALPYDIYQATPDARRTVSQPPVPYNSETAIDGNSAAVLMKDPAPVPAPTGVEAQPYKPATPKQTVKCPSPKGCK